MAIPRILHLTSARVPLAGVEEIAGEGVRKERDPTSPARDGLAKSLAERHLVIIQGGQVLDYQVSREITDVCCKNVTT